MFSQKTTIFRKPISGKPYKGQCVDCKKIIYRKKEIPYRKHYRHNYSWCSCGNDLIRDSYVDEAKKDVNGVIIYRYLCSNCGEESFWTFDIGICALRVNFDKYGNIKKIF